MLRHLSLAAASLIVLATASAPAVAQESQGATDKPNVAASLAAPSTAGQGQRANDTQRPRPAAQIKPPLKEMQIMDYSVVFPQLPDGIQSDSLPDADNAH